MAADGVVGGGLVKRLTDTVTFVGDGKAVAGAAAANADDADDGDDNDERGSDGGGGGGDDEGSNMNFRSVGFTNDDSAVKAESTARDRLEGFRGSDSRL